MKIPSRFSLLTVMAVLAFARPAAAQFTEFNAFKEPSSGSSSGAVAGPDLKAAADKVEAGKVTVGATAYVVAMFKNNGSSPVKVTGINLYPSSTVSAAVSLNKCAEAPLPPEAQCAVTVAVTGLQIGSWRVEVLLDHDGRTRLATAAMAGDVEGGAARAEEQVKDEIEADPAALDFGSSAGGMPLVRSVILRNRTSEKVDLTAFNLDAPKQSGFSFKSECPQALSPSESCALNVIWSPAAKGLAQGALRVNHSAKSRLTKIDLTGNFDPVSATSASIYPESVPDMGLLVADMDKIDFGSGIDGISAITMSLVNAGGADLTLKSIRLSGSDNGLSVARSGCKAGLTLKPVEACALTINWVPSRAGNVLDDLQILHSGARGVLIMPIRGSADAAASRESMAVRQPSAGILDSSSRDGQGHDGQGKGAAGPADDILFDQSTAAIAVTPVLDGYIVTSHSPTKAVVNGPVGSLVVRDGEDVVISGVKWTVTIVSTGVILSSDDDEILLVFDRSLRPTVIPTTASSDSSSTDTDDSADTSASTTTR